MTARPLDSSPARAPGLVASLLRSDALWLLARLLVTFMFWWAGIGFVLDFAGAQAMTGSFGLTPAWAPVWAVAVLTIAVQLLGSLLILADRAVWLGAGMLGVFTLLTIPLVHDFWNMEGAARTQAMLESEEHLTVIGGLIATSILSEVRRAWRAAGRP